MSRDTQSIWWVLPFTVFVFICLWTAGNNWYFSMRVTEELKLAADASTLETASDRIGRALDYLETHDKTEGHSHLLVESPENDVGHWYKNLKDAKSKADTILADPDATDESRDLALVQIRKALVDGSEIVTQPPYMGIFPHQRLVTGVGLISFLATGLIAVFVGPRPRVTLVEAMIVIAILGILASIAIG